MSDFQPNCTVVDAADYTVRYRGQLGTFLPGALAYIEVIIESEDAHRIEPSLDKSLRVYLFPIPTQYIIPDQTVTQIEVLHYTEDNKLQTNYFPVGQFEWFDESAWYHRHKLRQQSENDDL